MKAGPDERNGKKNNRRRRGRRNNRGRARRPLQPEMELICSICGKPIKYLYTAIEHGQDRGAVHFDCKLKELSDLEELGPNEKISYLGKGTFGIIKYQNGSGGKKFTIRKRITVEEQNVQSEWRKELGKPVRR